jgi:2-dehydro-3-deoxyphosphooctonate aldolase (KDO 8-P synthase)
MAGATGLPILFKKGQTMKPMDARHMVDKVAPEYPGPFAVCERGSAFGYGTVVDFSNFQVLQSLLPNSPIVFDCTHSAPSRDFAPAMAYAAMATGYVDGIFMEVHPNPAGAYCDGEKMIQTGALAPIIKRLKKLWEVSR